MIELKKIKNTVNLTQLSIIQVKELQIALNNSGFSAGVVDGILGKKTKTAWEEFKRFTYQRDFDLIGSGSIQTLEKKSNEPYNFSSKENIVLTIKREAIKQGLTLNTQHAYILATVEHETAGTFQPVKEGLDLSDNWRKNNLRYYPYYGRGYVQLTWRNNYDRYGKILNLDLVNNPDLALKHETSLFILIHGFKNGTFTGVDLENYVNNNKTDFINARRCINGTDRAEHIAILATKYL